MALLNYTRTISKEEYEEIMTASNGKGHVPSNLESKFFSEAVRYGYGLYGARVREKDGEYFLDYTTGDSCD